MSPNPTDPQALVEAIRREAGLLVVLTGAGVSLASGIPTFRGSDPDAIWSRDVTELATLRYFREDPVGSWRWYRQRFAGLLGAQPNAAHRAIAALERWQACQLRDFLLVTQNIDTLHEQAGSARIVKVHGSANRCRCSEENCRYGAIDSFPIDVADFSAFDREPARRSIPRCPECGALMRPHVLWFDEYYTGHADYQWHILDAAADRMRLLVCLGTSLAVGVTAFLQSTAARNAAPMFLVEPGRAPEDASTAIHHIRAKAEELMPSLIQSLKDESGSA